MVNKGVHLIMTHRVDIDYLTVSKIGVVLLIAGIILGVLELYAFNVAFKPFVIIATLVLLASGLLAGLIPLLGGVQV